MNKELQLPVNTTISKMETVGKEGLTTYFKGVEFDHLKPLEFDGFSQ
jgi:hypothetical protein